MQKAKPKKVPHGLDYSVCREHESFLGQLKEEHFHMLRHFFGVFSSFEVEMKRLANDFLVVDNNTAARAVKPV
ncbi:hypothetical protein K3556_15785 (plasmid) [Aliiroseovarius sp. M344]|uniref:hypothetical protein n=1 Tax=Aliiroseovarius sp. M344 TaxID=2867010 RepID=UPI0021AD7D6F|nr:hypothetical protein [Aliiroseovarius sp. M344]UWQ16043.1 hypothetical protein K3556_15785 [Aliiroseovarius sp. M344]